jgi:hypothetical protein
MTSSTCAAWQAGGELVATGRGTPNPYETADLFWSGSFGQAGDFYLIVEYSGDGAAPFYYSLDVSGANVKPTSGVAPGLSPVPQVNWRDWKAVGDGGNGKVIRTRDVPQTISRFITRLITCAAWTKTTTRSRVMAIL